MKQKTLYFLTYWNTWSQPQPFVTSRWLTQFSWFYLIKKKKLTKLFLIRTNLWFLWDKIKNRHEESKTFRNMKFKVNMKEIFINLFFIRKKNTFQSQKLKMFVPSSCVSWSSSNILACSTFSFSRLSISFRQSDFSIFFTRIFLSFLINFNNLKKLNYILHFFSLNIATRNFYFLKSQIHF